MECAETTLRAFKRRKKKEKPQFPKTAGRHEAVTQIRLITYSRHVHELHEPRPHCDIGDCELREAPRPCCQLPRERHSRSHRRFGALCGVASSLLRDAHLLLVLVSTPVAKSAAAR